MSARLSLWPALRLVGGVAVVGALVAKFGTGAVLDGLHGIDAAHVLAALALGLVSTAANAARWRLVARRLGMRLPFAVALGDYYQALFLNSVLPAGVLGDVRRAVGHGRHEGDVRRGVRAVILERLAGQAVLLLVAAGVLLAEPSLLHVAARLVPGPAVAALVGAALVAAWLLRSRVRAAAAGTRAVLRSGGGLGLAGLSALALAAYLATFLVAAGAAGVTAPVPELLPILVLALLATSLPLNVGGFGPREAAAAVGFGAIGLDAGQGLATSVTYGVLGLVAALPGALLLLAAALSPAAGRIRGTRRRTTPGSPARPGPSGPSPQRGDRRRPTTSTPAARGSAGAGGRPRPRPLARTGARRDGGVRAAGPRSPARRRAYRSTPASRGRRRGAQPPSRPRRGTGPSGPARGWPPARRCRAHSSRRAR